MMAARVPLKCHWIDELDEGWGTSIWVMFGEGPFAASGLELLGPMEGFVGTDEGFWFTGSLLELSTL
jgi:hypothetical protein